MNRFKVFLCSLVLVNPTVFLAQDFSQNGSQIQKIDEKLIEVPSADNLIDNDFAYSIKDTSVLIGNDHDSTVDYMFAQAYLKIESDTTKQSFSLSDSLKFIEEILGVRFANSTEYGGGVIITEVSAFSSFYAKRNALKDFIIQYVNTCNETRISNTSELCSAVYSLVKSGYPIMTFSGLQKIGDTTSRASLSTYSKKIKTFDFSSLFNTPILENDSIKKLGDDEMKNYAKCMYYQSMDNQIRNTSLTSTFGGILFGWYGAMIITALPLIDPATAPKYVNEQAKNLDSLGQNGTIYYKTYSKESKKFQTFARTIGSFAGAAAWCAIITIIC